MSKCIGLFGTCDKSTWRNSFIDLYESRGIEFFNPDAGDNWHPGMIDDENRHLNEDSIILFPVLPESLGTGSLGEIGFSVLNVMRNIIKGNSQFLVVFIADECTDERKTEAERKDSNRCRALVKTKMQAVNHPNVFMVETLSQMKDLSLQLWDICERYEEIRETINEK